MWVSGVCSSQEASQSCSVPLNIERSLSSALSRLGVSVSEERLGKSAQMMLLLLLLLCSLTVFVTIRRDTAVITTQLLDTSMIFKTVKCYDLNNVSFILILLLLYLICIFIQITQIQIIYISKWIDDSLFVCDY